MLQPLEMRGAMEKLRTEVVENGGLKSISMENLRNRCGARKLGIHVVAQIGKALRNVGLRFYPDPLPRYQERNVRVYDANSEAARLIDAFQSPSEAHDEILLSALGSEPSQIIEQIRDLVTAHGVQSTR